MRILPAVILTTFFLVDLSCHNVQTKQENLPVWFQKDHAIQQDNSIKTDLNGMTDVEIQDYFHRCISSGKTFIYTGGIANYPIIDKQYLNQLESFKFISIGCAGGHEEAKKFNQMMIDYMLNRK